MQAGKAPGAFCCPNLGIAKLFDQCLQVDAALRIHPVPSRLPPICHTLQAQGSLSWQHNVLADPAGDQPDSTCMHILLASLHPIMGVEQKRHSPVS